MELNYIFTCEPHPLKLSHIIGASANVDKCYFQHSHDPKVWLWLWLWSDTVNFDDASLELHLHLQQPNSTIARKMMQVEMCILGGYYLIALVGLFFKNQLDDIGGSHHGNFDAFFRFACIFGGGAQTWYTSIYLLWHWFAFDRSGYWVDVFLPTIPWVIAPSILAVWCFSQEMKLRQERYKISKSIKIE